jgi:outer membrane protein assembly factor BamB
LKRTASAAAAVLFSLAAALADWPQWGSDPQHTGHSSVAAQSLEAIVAQVVQDPFTTQEAGEAHGDLLLHYAVPLMDETGIYLVSKSGSYVSCSPPGSGQPAPCGVDARNLQVWNVRKMAWRSGVFSEVWTFASDWKPEPDAGGLSGWEPVFQPALAGGFVYVPGAGGSVFRLDRSTGNRIARVSPFGTVDPVTFVAGGLAADAFGNVFYNAIRLKPQNPWDSDVVGAWLVRVGAGGSATLVAFSTLVPDAPAASAQCENTFTQDLPWPPSPTAVPPTAPCGSQRPGLNAVPAVSPEGTVYTVSRAHRNGRYAYLVAVTSDLSPLWAASLREVLNDGCDVLLPPSGTPGGCRSGARRGVDPATNNRPAGQISDLGTSSPAVLPDGAILYGVVTGYNSLRGHLLKFSPTGEPLAAYDFGWDITPAVFPHDGSYSILIKDNHYAAGSYCGDPIFCPPESERYDLVSLSPDLTVQWRYTSANTESCERAADGTVTCVSDHPNGFEWCVNQPAVDANGVVYASSEDGFLYAVAPGGVLQRRIFLDLAIGAAYTPVSIDSQGRVYSQNNGRVFIVGAAPLVPVPAPRTGHPRAKPFN